MARRIPAEEPERLKREVSVERLAEARGLKLRRHGKDLIGLCPFHDDHEPSLVVSPEKNLWHCLGACQAGGSVVDWVMKAEGVSFRHAVELLRHDAVGAPASPRAGKGGAGRVLGSPAVELGLVQHSTVRRLPAPVALEAEDHELLRQVVDYYHETGKHSPDALRYLEDRGLRHPEMVDRFRLGFANRTLGLRLPEKNRLAGGELRGRLQKLGLFRDSGHEHFNGCVVFPIFDERGRVVEVYGRKIAPGLKPDITRHLYLPGPHRGVWNVEALMGGKEVILCEALIDALTFWCAGFPHVTAAYGVEGFTADHLEAFQRYGVERVLIAYDRDAAGERAAEKLAEKLLAVGIAPFRVVFPKGMDANEYALKVKPAEKSLGLVLRHAAWMGQGPAPALSVHTAPVEVVEEVAPAAKRETPVETGSAGGAAGEALAGSEVTEALAEVESAEASTEGEPAEAQAEEAPAPASVSAAPAEAPATMPAPEGGFPLVAGRAAVEVTPPAPPAAGALEPALPPPHALPVPTEIEPGGIVITLGDRRYRIRGLEKNLSYEQLRVNVLAGRGDAFHVDTLDLYSARQRAAYVKQAAEELRVKDEVVKKDLGRVLLKLEELQDEQIKKALAPETPRVEMREEEKAAALELLQDPRLAERILEDFERCGVVGEETNKLVGYLAAVSRKLDEPLAVVIQSSSAAGKTSLMEAILALIPEEERVQYSAMTGQSLFYMGETDLQHKVLAIVEEQGAERATYALKLLQSEGELTIASTGKDPSSGRLVTHEYRVEGPVAIFLTTTAVELDEELANRSLLLTVNEDREQTRAIHRLQRESQTLEGLLAREDRKEVVKVHRDAQRLLLPLEVINPYARELTFLDDKTRTRRDHLKYLALIRALAVLHQHQRPIETVERHGRVIPYVEASLADIELANRLAHEVLGRSLDELPPQTRRLLLLLDEAVREACERQKIDRTDFRFSRREVRQWAGWTDFQVRTHLGKLVALEYVLVHRGGRGQSFVYELLYDGQGQDGRPFLSGLIDVEALRGKLGASATSATSRGLEATSRGENGGIERPSSPQRALNEPPTSPGQTAANSSFSSTLPLFHGEEPENAHLERREPGSTVVGVDRSRSGTLPPLAAAARAAGG